MSDCLISAVGEVSVLNYLGEDYLVLTISVCVVADFGALRYQTEMVLMRAKNF